MMNCAKSFESSLALKCLCKSSFLRKENRFVHASAGRFKKDKRDHYEVLEIGKTSSTKEIRDAFIKLSKENHPDKNQSDPDNHEKFVRINEAYSVLSQPQSRSNYDRSLRIPRTRSSSEFRSGGATEFYGGPSGSSDFHGGFRSQSSQNRYDPFRKVAEEYIFHESMRRAREAAAKERGGGGASEGKKTVSNGRAVFLLLGLSILFGWLQVSLVKYANMGMQDRFKEEIDQYNTLLNAMDMNAKVHGNRYVINQLARRHDRSTGQYIDLDDMKDEGPKMHPEPVDSIHLDDVNDEGPKMQ